MFRRQSMQTNYNNLATSVPGPANSDSTEMIPYDENRYLHSLLMPWEFSSVIPDYNATAAAKKSVNLTETVTAPPSGEILLLYLPHNRGASVRVYFSISDRYIFFNEIPWDDDIAESYSLARFVSGALQVKTVTVSGLQFGVSGIIVATQYQDLPDLETLDYEKISSFKRSVKDTVIGVQIDEGVNVLAHPNGDHQFYAYDSTTVSQSRQILFIEQDPQTSPSGWLPTGQDYTSDQILFDSDNADFDIPDNLWGWVDVKFQFCFQRQAVSGGEDSFAMVLTLEYESTSDGITIDTANLQATVCAELLQVQSAQSSYMINKRFYLPASLTRILAQTDGTQTQWTPIYDTQSAFIELQSQEYFSDGIRGPGTMIGIKAITPGQKIEIAGVANYEAVPKSKLSKDVSTYYDRVENPWEMQYAEFAFSASNRLNIPVVATISSYERFVTSALFHKLLSNTELAQASGFTDWLGHVWNRMKPYMGAIAPVIGSMYGGPAGMATGVAVQKMLTASEFNDQSNSSTYNRGGLLQQNNGWASASSFKNLDNDESDFCEAADLISFAPGLPFYGIRPFYAIDELPGECDNRVGDLATEASSLDSENKETLNPIPRAELLGSAAYDAYVNHLTFRPSGANLTMSDLEPSNYLGRSLEASSILLQANTRSIMNGEVTAGNTTTNTFPLVEVDLNKVKRHVGTIAVSATELMYSFDGDFREVVHKERVQYSIGQVDFLAIGFIDGPSMGKEAHTAILLALAAASYQTGIREWSYMVRFETEFDGGSLGLATYASAMGLPIQALLSGAVALNSMAGETYFLPNDIPEKAKLSMLLNKPLIVAAELDDMQDENTRRYHRMVNTYGAFRQEGRIQNPIPVANTLILRTLCLAGKISLKKREIELELIEGIDKNEKPFTQYRVAAIDEQDPMPQSGTSSTGKTYSMDMMYDSKPEPEYLEKTSNAYINTVDKIQNATSQPVPNVARIRKLMDSLANQYEAYKQWDNKRLKEIERKRVAAERLANAPPKAPKSKNKRPQPQRRIRYQRPQRTTTLGSPITFDDQLGVTF